jgi:hypothetical protein
MLNPASDKRISQVSVGRFAAVLSGLTLLEVESFRFLHTHDPSNGSTRRLVGGTGEIRAHRVGILRVAKTERGLCWFRFLNLSLGALSKWRKELTAPDTSWLYMRSRKSV